MRAALAELSPGCVRPAKPLMAVSLPEIPAIQGAREPPRSSKSAFAIMLPVSQQTIVLPLGTSKLLEITCPVLCKTYPGVVVAIEAVVLEVVVEVVGLEVVMKVDFLTVSITVTVVVLVLYTPGNLFRYGEYGSLYGML